MSAGAPPPDPASGRGAALRVSVVVYRPDLPMLRDTLASLAHAFRHAFDAGELVAATVDLIDNGSAEAAPVDATLAALAGDARVTTRVLRGHGNVGYGRGHNLSILAGSEDVHLVLNPDVLLEPEALTQGLRYLWRHPDVALLSPRVEGGAGEVQYLVRRVPSVAALVLRGFAPAAIRGLVPAYLARQELRDRLGDGEVEVRGIPCATGCFMLMPGAAVRRIGGFDPAYFLYFEDFDLSLRLGAAGETAYVPDVRIRHFGGSTSRKGWLHVKLHARSALRFFSRHGWRLW